MRCLTGRPDALESALAGALRESKEQDPLAPIAVLIGGSLQRPYLQRRMASLCDGIVNVHFLMPSEFALALGERSLATAGRTPLPPLADRILLQRIVARQDGYFKDVRETPGVADALHRLFGELRRAGLDPDAFSAGAADACEMGEKADALSNLYSTFNEKRSGFYGADDALLAADPGSAPWKAIHIIGLTDPPLALRELIAELGKAIPTTIYLPQSGTRADEATGQFTEWLTAAGAAPAPLEPKPSEPPTTLDHARGQLFAEAHAAAPEPLDGTIRLFSAPDPGREIREVARTCLRWAERGLRFHEMAIAYRHADTYRSTIESVFAEAGIPVYLHEGTPLTERPLGRRIVSLIELGERKLERRRIAEFLSEAALPTHTYDALGGNFRPSLWDRISRDAGVVEGLEQWRDRLAGHAVQLRARQSAWAERDAENTEHLLSFVEELDRDLNAGPEVGSWTEHFTALRTLLTKYVSGSEDVLETLEGMERVDALAEEIDRESFRELVLNALANLRSEEVLHTRRGLFARRGVNVLDVNSLRLLSFRAVAVVGLIERQFPSAPRQDPLLLDAERVRLNEATGRPIPLRAMGPDPEPLQFWLATASARERFVASYPRRATGQSRPQLPSLFFRAIAEAVTGETVPAAEVDSLPTELFHRIEGSRLGAPDLAAALSTAERDRTLMEQDPALGRALLIEGEPRVADALESRAAQHGRRLGPHDGVLSEEGAEALAELLAHDAELSPTLLESYARCPHRVLLRKVFRIEPIEEPENVIQISALERGDLVHRILQRFLSEDPDPGPLLQGPREEERLLAIAAEESTKKEATGETGYAMLWRYDREAMFEDLRTWLQREREADPFADLPKADYEVRFGRPWSAAEEEGNASRDEPITVEVDGAPLKIGGRIDRLAWDKKRTRFAVTDYKTGRSDYGPGDGELKGGEALQLPLYLLAAAQILEIDPDKGDASYYYLTRKGEFAVRSFTGEHLESRRDDLQEVLERISTGIRRGEFPRAPVKDGCKWCEFDQVCPAARNRLIEGKSGDKVAKGLEKLREIE